MTGSSHPRAIDPTELPDVVTSYLAAHRAHDTDSAIQSYASDAVVIDDGKTYEGLDEIRAWLSRSTTEYEYTTELTHATIIDEAHYVATHHLAGNFPGGQVDLDYEFTLSDRRIIRLTVQPA